MLHTWVYHGEEESVTHLGIPQGYDGKSVTHLGIPQGDVHNGEQSLPSPPAQCGDIPACSPPGCYSRFTVGGIPTDAQR